MMRRRLSALAMAVLLTVTLARVPRITRADAAVVRTTASATDDKSQALLGELQKKVAAMGDYRVEFSVTLDGQSVTGSYEVSGEAYRIETPDIVLYCDGKTKYEVNLLDREVSIDAVDPDDRSVLANPTRLFDFLDGSYTHRYVGPALVNGVKCELIELKETTESPEAAGQQHTKVFVSAASGLPVRIVYQMAMLGTDAVIDIVKVTPRVVLDRRRFEFDPGRYAGFEVIDFR